MGILDDLGGPELSAAPDVKEAPIAQEAAPAGFLESLESKSQAKPPEKAPSWSEVPLKAVVNAPGSALEFGKNLVHPFLHPIDTAEGLGRLGLGVMEKLGGKMGLETGQGYEKYADAVGEMLMKRYGSEEAIRKTLATDPVGVAADVSMILTGGGSAAARLPGYAGKIGEATAAVGRATDPLSAVTGAGKLVGKVGSEALGHQTGLGPEAIKEMAASGMEGGAAGQAFRDNMRGTAPMERAVEDARGALENMRKERGDEYRAGMSAVGLDTTVLNWNKVGQAIRDTADVSNFKGQELKPKTAAIRQELNDIVLDWMALPAKDFHTPEGFDALKKKIGDIRDSLPHGTPEKLVANKYYSAVRQSIVDQVPEYARVMNGYEEASDILRQIEKTLSLPPNERKTSVDTSLRKLQSVLRNNVNTNYGYRQKLVEYLENNGAPNLKAALAGQSANSFSPRGLSKVTALLGAEGVAALAAAWFTTPWAAAVAAPALAASSPRIVGETVHGISRGVGKAAIPGKYIFNKPTLGALQQSGRYVTSEPYRGANLGPLQQARGGAVDRALRATRRT